MSNIDDIFKEHLENEGIQYTDSYWDEMEDMLDGKKKKKAFFKTGYIVSFILGFLIAFLLFLGLQKDTSAKLVNNTNSAAASASKNEIGTEAKSEVVNVDKQSSGTKELIPGGEILPRKSIAPLKLNGTELPNNLVFSQENKTTPEETATNSENILQPDLNKIIEVTVNDDDGVSLGIHHLLPLRPKVNIPEDLTIIPPAMFKNSWKPLVKTVVKDTVVKSLKWRYYIAPAVEYDNYSRKINSAMLKRDEKTLSKAGYNFNFIAKRNNWTFKTGIGLLQLTEQTNYQNINKSYQIDTIYRMVNPNFTQSLSGSPVSLIKRQIISTETSTSSINNPNARVQFSYIKIPVLAGYEMKMNKLSFFLEAGVNSAILVQRKGNYTTFENNQFKVEDSKRSMDIKRFMFQTYTSFGIKYPIAKSFNICGGYGFAQSLNSMLKSYNQKATINFFTVGLEMRL